MATRTKKKKTVAKPKPRPKPKDARQEAGASSKKGVTERNPELEALIDERPSDPQRYLVYADWLQQRGDPRGELIVLQHAIATTESFSEGAKLEKVEATLFQKYEQELLGPLAEYMEVRVEGHKRRALAWRYGFVRAIRIAPYGGGAASTIVRGLLAHTSGRFVERIVLGGLTGEHNPAKLWATLSERAPRTLDTLVVGQRWASGSDLRKVWSALPRLRVLLIGHGAELGDVRADALERLDAERVSGEAIARATWPALTRLRIAWCSPEQVSRILRGETTPKLDHLVFTHWTTQAEGLPVPEDTSGIEVAMAAASRKLRRLDLSVPFSADGAQSLLARANELRTIRELRIPKAAISAGVSRSTLRAAIPSITWTEDPLEDDDHEDLEPLNHARESVDGDLDSP